MPNHAPAWPVVRKYVETVKELFKDKLLALAVFGSLARVRRNSREATSM